MHFRNAKNERRDGVTSAPYEFPSISREVCQMLAWRLMFYDAPPEI